MVADPADLPECGPDDVEVRVRWEHGSRGLVGEVVLVNVGSCAGKVSGKPALVPLKADGQRLEVANVVTAELRLPGYVVLEPRQRAVAPIAWLSWCGAAPADRMLVSWPGGSAVAKVEGPVRPDCQADQPENLSSSWFERDESDD